MKKFKLHAIALLVVASSVFTSCSNNDDIPGPSVVLKESLVTVVTGPETANLNQEVSLTTSFVVENSCGAFNKFIETTVGNTKTIVVEANYVGSNCVATPATKTATYKFKSATAGTYNLKFKKTATEFITHTIVVE